VWLTAGPASLYQEDVPEGVLTDSAVLQAPPQAISAVSVLEPNLPEAWAGGVTTARAIADALATKAGKPLPWSLVHKALDGAFAARYLERTQDSGPWPCDAGGAAAVRVRIPAGEPPGPKPIQPPPPPPPQPGVHMASAYLSVNEVQNLAEQIGELKKLAMTGGLDLRVHVQIELSGGDGMSGNTSSQLNELLQTISDNLKLDN
jgi:hypothetical protein